MATMMTFSTVRVKATFVPVPPLRRVIAHARPGAGCGISSSSQIGREPDDRTSQTPRARWA